MSKIINFGLSNKYYISLMCKIINAGTAFIMSILLSRWLGVVNKGELAYITELVEIGFTLFSLSLGTTYLTYKKKYGAVIQPIFVYLTSIHAIFVLVLGGIASFFCKWLSLDIVILVAISVVWFNFNAIAVIEDNIIRNYIYTTVDVLHIITLSICYYLGLNNLGVAVFALGASRVICTLLLVKKYNFYINYYDKNIAILDVYKSSVITMVFMLLITLNYKIDVVMMKYFSDSYNIGIYSVATTLANLFLLIPDSFKEVLFGESIKRDFKESTFASIKISFLLSVLVFIVYLFLGKFFISILYGESFSSSFYVLCILWIATLPLGIFKILQPLYIANGMQIRAVYYLVVSVTVNVLMNAIILPMYGCFGAAVSTTVSYTICCVLFLFGSRKLLSL